jgi:putative ABC transport system permease protein
VRIALGATPDQIAKLILAHGMVVVGTGAAVGLSCVLVFGRALESLTYVTTPRDPIAVGLALAAIGVVTAAALFMPTRRAARTNPADVLRGL